MDRKPTNDEWTEVLRPFLSQFYNQSARKKLCQLHRGAVKECKGRCFWPTGETCLYTINAREIKVLVISPDGSSAYLEYDASGQLIRDTWQSPEGACPAQ